MRGFAERYPQEQLAQFPDFLADWQKVQQQQAVESSSMTEQLGRGFSRGVLGLEASGAGALALTSDLVGAQGAKDFYLDIYKRKQKQLAEEAPASVPTIQQATQSLPAAGQYLAGKVGELVPNIGEALVFAGAGTLAAPGPGTEAGAAAGFFGRAAARSALKRVVEKTLTAAERKELEDFAAGKVIEEGLSPAVAKVVKDASGHLASIGTSAANFAALGAGGAYGELSGQEGVTPEGARTGALIAGAGASMGALIPERIIKGIFGDKAATDAVRTWIDSKAVTVPKELLVAGGGMGAMEFFNILGERYADPKKRDTDFTKEEWSRLLNATAVGILAGTPAAAIAALRRAPEGKPPPAEAPATETEPPAPPAGAETTPPPPPAPPAPAAAESFPTAPVPKTQEAIMESRRLLLEAQRQAAAEMRQESKQVEVPATPAEERTSVLDEIRKNEAKTVREIQELFPKSELSREQARELRNAAWGAPDTHVAETYGKVTAEQKLVLLEIANKEVSGTLTDADREYIQQLPVGQQEQYKLIREGVEDATQKRTQQKGVQPERVGDNAQLQKAEEDRVKQAEQQKESAQAGTGDSLRQAAGGLDPTAKAALKSAGIDVDALTTGIQSLPPGTDVDSLKQQGWIEAWRQDRSDAPEEGFRKGSHFGTYEQAIAIRNREIEAGRKPGRLRHVLLRIGNAFETTDEGGWEKEIEKARKIDPTHDALVYENEGEKVGGKSYVPFSVDQVREIGDVTPVDEAVARARAKALSEKPAAERKVEPKAAPVVEKPAAPAPVETGAAPWLAKVPEAYNAWQPVIAGKEEINLFGRPGASAIEKEGNSYEVTNSLGVFQRPDGKIVVGTLKQTGKPRVNRVQANATSAKSYEALIKEGWKPLGAIRTGDVKQSKVFHEYTADEWAKLQPQLEAKAAAGKAAVIEAPAPTKAEVVEAGLHEKGGIVSDTGRGSVTKNDAGAMADGVIKASNGIPPDVQKAKEYLSDVLLKNPELMKRIVAIGGKNDTGVYLDLFDRYEDAFLKFQKSGSTDPAEFRSGIVAALEGLSSKESRARAEAAQAVPEELRYEGELEEGGPPSEEGTGGSQYLATSDIGRDRDTSPEFQAAVRNILYNAKNAYEALVALSRSGALGDSAIVKDLIDLGDHGTKINVGGRHLGQDGKESSGRYDPMTHTAIIYDAAFEDGASLRTFLHEYVHGNTVFNMETGRNRGELTFLYEFAREQAEKQGQSQFYGLTNHAEFVAEAFSDPKFQSFLRSIKSTGVNKSLWTRFVEWVGSLLGIRDATLLDDVLSVGRKLSGQYKTRRTQVPESATTVQWHTPANVTESLVETYNPVTGVVDKAQLVQDSVEAAMLNIQQNDPLEFLLPAGTKGPLPTVNPVTRMNNEAAINTRIEQIRNTAAQEAGVALKAFRTLFGLHDTETVRARQINEANVKGVQGFNPNQPMDALHHPANVDYVNTGATAALEREVSKVSRRTAEAKEALPKQQAAQQKLITEHQAILDNFKDAEFMSGLMKRGVKKLLYEDIRDLERIGKALGSTFRQYQDIEGKLDQPIDPAAVAAMRRLYTGDALQGEQLFNFLDQMANDPSIDFTRPASEIRAYIRHAAEMDPTLQRYAQLAADTPDAKALLATVVAFGKLNQRQLALLQVRKMASGEQRLQLEQELKDQRKETNEQILAGIRSVAKASRLEEAAKLENRKALRMIVRANRNVEHTERVIAAGEAAMPHYSKEVERLSAKIQNRTDAVFTDGMKIRVPSTMDANPKFEEKTLRLKSTSTAPVTTPDQLKAYVGQMAAWLKSREQAAQSGDETAMGTTYQGVKQQVYEIINHEVFEPMLRETDFTGFELTMSADGKAVGAIGTPTTGLIEQGMNKFAGDTTNLRTRADRDFGYKNSRLRTNVMNVLNEGTPWYRRKRVTSPEFIENMVDSVLGFMERGKAMEGRDLETSRDEWYSRAADWLLSQDHIEPLIRDRMPQFMKAMREYADSIYEAGQWWRSHTDELGVKDPKLGGKLRKHVDVGLWTFQRKFSDGFRNMIHVMRAAGWSKDEEAGIPGASEEWKQIGTIGTQDEAKAQAMVDKYMTDTVQKDFAYKLAHVPDESVFQTPVLDDSGTRMSAQADDVAQAYDESGGNLIEMFKRLHDVYNGQEAVWSYIQSGLLRMAAVYHEIDNALKKVEPKGNVQVAGIEGMVPNAMIDARQFQHLPADWFTYHKFDLNDNARMAERVAWQSNFGRDGKRFAGWYATAQEETRYLSSKLEDALTRAEKLSPNSRKKEIDAAAAKILSEDKDPALAKFKTGQDKLRYLRKVKSRAPFLDNLLPHLSDYFNRGNQEEGSLRWGIRVAGELASLLVNRPGAAIAQMATTLDIMAKWGLSPVTLKATSTAVRMTSKDIAGSLAQGVGWEFLKTSQYEKRLNEMHLNDPEVARRMGDINAVLTGEEHRPFARFFRQAKDVQSATLNLLGEKAQYTPLRIFAPFFQMVMSTNRGLFVALSEMADGFVSKGIEYLESNPGNEKLTADMLGLKGENKRSFELWEADHRRFGLDFTDMVKGAIERKKNGDNTVLTNKELERIFSVALQVISLESNVGTMPLWAFNNSLVRFGLPLLGWSFRRAVQVPGLRLDAKDQNSLKAVRSGLMGMAAVGLGGLGLSLVVDAYSEEVLGKRRNLRGLQVPVTGNDWIGIQERLNRVGTFGLWGELINAGVNVGTGQGDNRLLSVDQRVVAMQAFQSLMRASSAFINQNFDADYQHVVRPAISAIGGGGMLEYMQIFNHAFDLDNVENRVVKRINAENYLRVTGRDLGMSIRTGGGGYNTPTPITPWIARMEYAAYANDPTEFREMYQGAKAEAKKAGKPDPADYVKRAFETRHPLRYVFSQTPSERDYREILGNLDDTGREAVSDAVRLFNYYGAHLGLAPFAGSKKKDVQRAANPAAASRARELALGY